MFPKWAADADMTPAHLRQMAETVVSNSGVKDFGQKLDHVQAGAYGEVDLLVQQTGAPVPRGIDVAKDQALETELKGARFDRAFVQQEM